MGYSLYDQEVQGVFRFSGYGVTAYCDHPGCMTVIDRGMGYACCDGIHFDGSCGGFYCADHQHKFFSEDEFEELEEDERRDYLQALGLDDVPALDEFGNTPICTHSPIEFKEHPDWIKHIEKDKSWKQWRKDNSNQLKAFKERLK